MSSASLPVWAVKNVVVVALFANKAVVHIDGQRRVLTVGERSKEGVLLVSANSEEAVLDVEGVTEVYPLGMHISVDYAPPDKTEVTLWANSSGMFHGRGSINGQLVDFLVDTGATTIALNRPLAKRLGIDYLYTGAAVDVHTASSVEVGYQVTLKSVKVGEIALQNVRAIVIDGMHPSKALLGMSFLSRLEMDRRGNRMVLRKKN